MTGVDHGIGTHEPRNEHLVEAVHFLTPESGAPRLVERADGAVLAFAPQAEGVERVVGVVIAIVPPVLVAHVPGGHVRVGAVAFGELAAQGERVFLEYRAGRAPRLARAGVDGVAEFVARQHFGMLFVQPQRRGGRGGGEVCCNAGFAELVDDAIEPAEVPAIFLRLDAVPAEDGEGNRVDTGFFHEADVVVPRFFRPLVGIVVAAECDTAAVFRQQFRPCEGLAFGGCGGCSGCGGYGGFAGMNLHVIAFPNVFGTTVYHLIFLILDTFAILSNPDIRMYLRSTATGWHSLAISYAHLRSTGARLAESPSFDIAFRTHPDESQFSARRERKRVVQDGRTPPSAHGTTKRDEIAGRERKATNLIKTEPAIPSSNAEETAPRHTGPRASIGCAKSPMRQPRHNQPFKPRREHFYQETGVCNATG